MVPRWANCLIAWVPVYNCYVIRRFSPCKSALRCRFKLFTHFKNNFELSWVFRISCYVEIIAVFDKLLFSYLLSFIKVFGVTWKKYSIPKLLIFRYHILTVNMSSVRQGPYKWLTKWWWWWWWGWGGENQYSHVFALSPSPFSTISSTINKQKKYFFVFIIKYVYSTVQLALTAV